VENILALSNRLEELFKTRKRDDAFMDEYHRINQKLIDWTKILNKVFHIVSEKLSYIRVAYDMPIGNYRQVDTERRGSIMNFKDLSEKDKESISNHYQSEFKEFTRVATQAVADAVLSKDTLALAWLGDFFNILIMAACDRIDAEDKPVNKNIKGWPVH
jgi:hypothetical protein